LKYLPFRHHLRLRVGIDRMDELVAFPLRTRVPQCQLGAGSNLRDSVAQADIFAFGAIRWTVQLSAFGSHDEETLTRLTN